MNNYIRSELLLVVYTIHNLRLGKTYIEPAEVRFLFASKDLQGGRFTNTISSYKSKNLTRTWNGQPDYGQKVVLQSERMRRMPNFNSILSNMSRDIIRYAHETVINLRSPILRLNLLLLS